MSSVSSFTNGPTGLIKASFPTIHWAIASLNLSGLVSLSISRIRSDSIRPCWTTTTSISAPLTGWKISHSDPFLPICVSDLHYINNSVLYGTVERLHHHSICIFPHFVSNHLNHVEARDKTGPMDVQSHRAVPKCLQAPQSRPYRRQFPLKASLHACSPRFLPWRFPLVQYAPVESTFSASSLRVG